MSAPSAAGAAAGAPYEETWLGHPKGLFTLFFAELWERFCFYGMRALLAVYVAEQFTGGNQGEASKMYGAYTALIYALGVFGGSVADKVLGFRRSIVLGGTLMAMGAFTLMFKSQMMFLLGLSLLIVGNGLFKPNISTLVGKLYKQGDARRDGGFTIFYMGINLGAFLAPIICRAVAGAMGTEGKPDYRYGFMAAGVGMVLGIFVFWRGFGTLGDKGLPPAGREGMGDTVKVAIGCLCTVPVIYSLMNAKEIAGYAMMTLMVGIFAYLLYVGMKSDTAGRQRIYALILLLLCNIVFWASFEQAGNSLNFFARDHINALTLGKWAMPFEWFQSVNAIFIVGLGPVFAWLWVWLDRRGANPSIPFKFGIGLVQVGLGFMLLLASFKGADAAGRVPYYMLTGLYLIHTTGELCVSPVGLSMITKLAPPSITGLVMGGWFLSIANANYAAGWISSLAGQSEVGESTKGGVEALSNYTAAFTPIIWMSIGVGGALLLSSRLVNKLMHGVK